MLEEFLGKEEVAQLMGQDFVDLSIDQEKLPDGMAFADEIRKGKKGGIPWFAFVDPNSGDILATADGANGNVGCPMTPGERGHFMACLRKARVRLTEDQLQKIDMALHEFAFETIGKEAGILPNDPRISASSKEILFQYKADEEALGRLWRAPFSIQQVQAWKKFYQGWQFTLIDLEENDLDLFLLKNKIKHRMRQAKHEQKKDKEALAYAPFAPELVKICEQHAARETLVPKEAAGILHEALQSIESAQEQYEEQEDLEIDGALARRIRNRLNELQSALGRWYRFNEGYDPDFSWWCHKPWDDLKEALDDYTDFILEDLGGLDAENEDEIVGDPIGKAALMDELRHALIPYTPTELIAIAEKEFAWCENEMTKAVQELPVETWKDALEYVKDLHVEPGQQHLMIRDMADEAVEYLEERDLITIPDLAKKVWRMNMMSPERQKFSPYFTGGEVISIAYPTDEMTHEEKMMSMRGNNRHFSRAAVHHELIPGHHLQSYMANRWNTQRKQFYTPFLVEGWALYWELKLWDLNFPETAEDKVGMLFWRSHRCARIIFSLNFHLGNWSAEECVDFLTERVGHEQNNAEAEVRRSVQGGYGPLYQAAYMLGGLQLRALHQELVVNGDFSERQFHDAILQQGPIPVAAIRAALTGADINADLRKWRFAD